MQQIFYTQEGVPYVLKSVTKFTNPIALAVNTLYKPHVLVNLSNYFSTLPQPDGLDLKTDNKIIPLSMSFAFVLADGTPTIDVTTPYYYMIRGGAPNFRSLEPLKCLSKAIPLTSMIYFTDANHFFFDCKYGQIVFEEGDFIDPTGGLQIQFENGLANALANTTSLVSQNAGAGNYSAAVTFTYFELQLKTK